MFADHLSSTAKLFQAANAELTSSAVCQIMYADPIAGPDMLDIGADFFDSTCDFVPKRYRQKANPGNAVAIMRIGMTNSRSGDANQNFGRANLRNWNIRIFQRFSDLP
jgi:hypothetical protein